MTSFTKKITNEIKSFLDTNFAKTDMKKSRFSTRSKNMLIKIFKLIIQSEKEWCKTKFTTTTTKNIIKGTRYDFIPRSIQNHIENMNKTCRIFSFLIGNRKFNVHITYSNVTLDTTVENHIRKIFMWLYIANFYAKQSECSQYIDIFLFMTDVKKIIPDGKSITPTDANTAFTTACKPVTEIHIFREEEWFKVLIHETFHCMGLDFSQMDCSLHDKNILSLFPVKSNVRIYETYCEMWAEIINVMFISYQSTRNVENIELMIEKTEKMMNYERMFSLFQCVKVLQFYSLTYKNLYGSSREDMVLRNKNYREETQALSYYVIKSIFMFVMNDFIEWCAQNNKGSLSFTKNDVTVHSFCSFVREHYTDSDFLYGLDIVEKWWRKPHKKNNVINTLRMTVFE